MVSQFSINTLTDIWLGIFSYILLYNSCKTYYYKKIYDSMDYDAFYEHTLLSLFVKILGVLLLFSGIYGYGIVTIITCIMGCYSVINTNEPAHIKDIRNSEFNSMIRLYHISSHIRLQVNIIKNKFNLYYRYLEVIYNHFTKRDKQIIKPKLTDNKKDW